jgi:exodeoxyribonuclease VII large subunit
LLDRNRRHVLSPVPLRIGVVTSVGTAAWHDFRHEIEQSELGFLLVVCDVRVQGEFAASMVAAGIGTLDRRHDLDAIVVIRGGGAKNELAVFDSELIARTIAAARRPVLTGLGHEVDRSVADEVAHTALKTPTACAGALVERVVNYRAGTEEAWSAIRRRSEMALGNATTGLSDLAHRIARRTHAVVERSDERLTMRVDRLVRCGPTVLAGGNRRLDAIDVQVAERSARVLQRSSDRLDVLAARVSSLDPAVQLARGWSITRNSDGSVIRSIDDVATGATITTSIVDGSISSSVHDTAPIEGPST